MVHHNFTNGVFRLRSIHSGRDKAWPQPRTRLDLRRKLVMSVPLRSAKHSYKFNNRLTDLSLTRLRENADRNASGENPRQPTSNIWATKLRLIWLFIDTRILGPTCVLFLVCASLLQTSEFPASFSHQRQRKYSASVRQLYPSCLVYATLGSPGCLITSEPNLMYLV